MACATHAVSRVLLAVFALAFPSTNVALNTLPDGPIIAAWHNGCNEMQTLHSVKQGVNVIFWFSVILVKDKDTQQPKVAGGPDPACIAKVRASIENQKLPTSHLISIGGWNTPPPDISFSGAEWFDAWNEWNSRLPVPFDGFDWDLEGNDLVTHPYNEIQPECLQLVIDMSVAAKKAGLLVTLAPPQSYFDVTTGQFNRFLNNSDSHFHPEFYYRGRNSYAYIFAAAPAGTFDLVEVQLYETFAPALRSLNAGVLGEDYLRSWVANLLSGWMINVTDPLLPLKGLVPVHLDSSRLLVGISFAPGGSPGRIRQAYQAAEPQWRPRGYAFWCIGLEGTKVNGTTSTVEFASSLNSFLHVRSMPPEDSTTESLFP